MQAIVLINTDGRIAEELVLRNGSSRKQTNQFTSARPLGKLENMSQ